MAFKTSQSYFHINGKTRRGSLFLIVIVAFVCMFPLLYVLVFKQQVTEETKFDNSLAALRTKKIEARQQKSFQKEDATYRPYDHPSAQSYTRYASSPKGILFNFDPNTVSVEGWKKLGLRDKTIATIINFRTKGGKFRDPDDIRKIWGLFPDEANRLIPYIQIAQEEAKNVVHSYASSSYSRTDKEKYATRTLIDANTADTAAFIALPGIGSKLSQRIINFRDRLGGFHDVEQVKETFGLQDSVYQKIKPLLQVSGPVKQLNINTALTDELKMHPYIKYHIANALVEYRKQHGNFQSLDDIKKIMIITDEAYRKMAPYLKTE